MTFRHLARASAILAVAALAACDDSVAPDIAPTLLVQPADVPAPSPLVAFGGEEFWPYTADHFTGPAKDPVAFVFLGAADPRDLRATLTAIGGDRTVLAGTPFEPLAMFDCTWTDALGGDVQIVYGGESGWVGSAVQLECGDYAFRFHLRLFDIGDVTLGGVHLEFQVPGTSEHQVIGWEIAEQLVIADFFRSGLLGAPPASTGPITPEPYFRTIDAVIWEAMAGVPGLQDLAYASGAVPLQSGEVGIGTDGAATALTLGGSYEAPREVTRREWTIEFDQVIPKPFCQETPFDYLYATGPVQLRQQVVVTASGNHHSNFHALGTIELLPLRLDVSTGQFVPIGEPYRAHVSQRSHAVVTDHTTHAAQLILQIEMPPRGPFRGTLRSVISVGAGSSSHESLVVTCEP